MSEPETIDDIKEPDEPKATGQGRWRRLRTWFLWFNVAVCSLMLCVVGVLEFLGESNIYFSLPLFLPAWGWCIPSILLIPVSALINWRCIPMHTVFIAIIAWGYMDFEYNSPSSDKADLSIIAYNYGQRRGTEVDGFIADVQPDVMILSEAPSRSTKYKQRFPEMHFAEVDEFVIMSRYEVIDARKAVTNPDTGKVRVACFVIGHPKEKIAIYAVHLPTPRQEFNKLRSTRVGALPGRRLLQAESRARYHEYLDNKAAITRDLLLELETDPAPCVVVGDFNTPPKGVIYRKLTSRLTDCFNKRGKGYGFTFPGDAGSLYAFKKPWLRIDYIFCDDKWVTCDFVTETGRESQHLAVAARLRLK